MRLTITGLVSKRKQLMKYRFPSDVKKQLAAATRSPPRVRECESLHTEPDTLHR